MLFEFELQQFRWYRKWRGGSWLHTGNAITSSYWSRVDPKCCGSYIIAEEHYNDKGKKV